MLHHCILSNLTPSSPPLPLLVWIAYLTVLTNPTYYNFELLEFAHDN